MNTIYYFSGTGNSLAISKKLNDILNEKSEIKSIPRNIGQGIKINADIVGIVFPVYFHDIPDIVKQFIANMEFESSPYIYAIATMAGEIGHSFYTINKLLNKKSKELSLGISITMPGNAVVTDINKEPEMLINANKKMIEIADSIQKREKKVFDGTNSIKDHIHTSIVTFLSKYFEFSPKRYKLKDSCSGCGTCEKICPVHNIKLTQNKPFWQKNCTYCLACFHWCPKEAIYMNNMVIKDRRKYHNPEVSMSELITCK